MNWRRVCSMEVSNNLCKFVLGIYCHSVRREQGENDRAEEDKIRIKKERK